MNVHRYCTLEAKILQAVLRAYLGYKANHVSRKSMLRFSGFEFILLACGMSHDYKYPRTSTRTFLPASKANILVVRHKMYG